MAIHGSHRALLHQDPAAEAQANEDGLHDPQQPRVPSLGAGRGAWRLQVARALQELLVEPTERLRIALAELAGVHRARLQILLRARPLLKPLAFRFELLKSLLGGQEGGERALLRREARLHRDGHSKPKLSVGNAGEHLENKREITEILSFYVVFAPIFTFLDPFGRPNEAA